MWVFAPKTPTERHKRRMRSGRPSGASMCEKGAAGTRRARPAHARGAANGAVAAAVGLSVQPPPASLLMCGSDETSRDGDRVDNHCRGVLRLRKVHVERGALRNPTGYHHRHGLPVGSPDRDGVPRPYSLWYGDGHYSGRRDRLGGGVRRDGDAIGLGEGCGHRHARAGPHGYGRPRAIAGTQHGDGLGL
eukprot:scaffold10469_cov118-Isochrysis_galbana.AAC.8